MKLEILKGLNADYSLAVKAYQWDIAKSLLISMRSIVDTLADFDDIVVDGRIVSEESLNHEVRM